MKALKIIAITIGLLFLAVLILPFVFRGKITELVKTEVNKAVDAKVDFGKVSLSLLRGFPDFSLRIKDLSIIGNTPFAGDTLLYARQFNLKLDVMSVLSGSPLELKEIQLNEPLLQLIVLADGSANWDIVPTSNDESTEGTTEDEAFTIGLKAINVDNARVVYNDRELNFLLQMAKFSGVLNGDLSMDQTRMNALLKIESINVNYDGMTLLKAVEGQTKLTIDANLAESIYRITSEQLSLNALELDFDGVFNLTETAIGMDFEVSAPNGTFKQLLSILPEAYLKDYQNLIAEGKFVFGAQMKGDYTETSFPAFGVQLKVADGLIAYPELPEKLENIQLALAIENPSGDMDQTLIQVQPLTFSMKENSFKIMVNLEPPLSDPLIDAEMIGKINLESLAALLPPETFPFMKGLLDVNFMLRARQSALENEQFDAIDATGAAKLTAFSSSIEGWENGLKLEKGAVIISPKAVHSSIEGLQLGKSDFTFSGDIQNYLSYIAGDGKLKGILKVSSDRIDANELLHHFASSPDSIEVSDSGAFSLDLPERIAMAFDANVKQLLYENFDLRDVQASIQYDNKSLNFQPLRANIFGGEIRMAGMLDAIDNLSPFINLDFNISNFDIPMAYNGIGLFQAAAPIASKTQGSFSTNFNLKGRLDENLQPVFSSLQGGGGLSSSQLKIESVQTMNTLASLLGNDDYKRLITDGINLSFEFVNGRIFQKPFTLKYAGSDVNMSGSIGFDQTLDYNLLLMIPFEKLGNQVTSGLKKLVSEAGNQGFNLNPGTNIQVKAIISGTATNPKVSIDYKDYAKNIKADINKLAQEEIEKQKQALKAQLNEQAEKLLNDAKKQGDQLIAQADAAAKTVREEAQKAAAKLRNEGNIQAENLIAEGKKKGIIAERLAVEAAKKLRDQSNKNADNIEREADEHALKLQQEARAKADALIAEANRKAASLN